MAKALHEVKRVCRETIVHPAVFRSPGLGACNRSDFEMLVESERCVAPRALQIHLYRASAPMLVSREFHPQPLAELYVTLSRHIAPVIGRETTKVASG